MSLDVELDPAVRDLGLAIGLLRTTGGGSVRLDADFFRAPWNGLSRIFTDEDQRAALVSAIEQLAEPFAPELLGTRGSAMPEATVRSAYPLLEDDAPGQVLITLSRDGQAAGAPLQIGIAAEVAAAGGGPGATAELVLLTAQGSAIEPVAGTAAFPLTITVNAPLGGNGQWIAATLAVVAPPDHAQSRFTVQLDIGDGAPMRVDLTDANPALGRLAVLLLELAIAQIDPLPEAAARFAGALPGLAGFDEGMPEFPFGRLFDDPAALRSWAAALATRKLADGTRALEVWVESLATLVGARVEKETGRAGDPILLHLSESTSTLPALAFRFSVGSDPSLGVSALEIGLSLIHSGDPAVDARIRGEALLLTIPVSADLPVRALDRFAVLVEASASGAPLVPAGGSGGGQLGIGGLAAGLSCRVVEGSPRIDPVLELSDVTIGLGSGTSQFDRVDFTQFTSLAGAAETVLENELKSGLGDVGARAVDALKILLGLGTSPSLDLATLATDPAGAFGDYYRARLGTSGGWKPVVEALGMLLGNPAALAAEGTGSADDPWWIDLQALPVTQPEQIALRLECWNSGTGASPCFGLALRAMVLGPGWDAGLRLGLVELPLAGNADQEPPRWLPHVELIGRANTDGRRERLGGIAVSADAVILTAGWKPGGNVIVDASIAQIAVDVGGERQALGSLSLADLGALNPSRADLGLGLDADALWPALRTLLAHGATRILGDGAAAVLALFGIRAGDAAAHLDDLPPLDLPPGSDLTSALRDPLGLIRSWLARVIQESGPSVVAGGGPAAWLLVRQLRVIVGNDSASAGSDAIAGGGSPADPWRIPIGGEDARAELTFWLGPDGPPSQWGAAALDELASPAIDASRLLAAAEALRGHAEWIGPILDGRDRSEIAAGLTRLDAFIGSGDGVLPIEAAIPVGGEWETGPSVDAAHADLPAHPAAVAQAAARIALLTDQLAAADWSVVLLAPSLAGPGCWDALITAVGDDPADLARLSLRVPGIPPHLADLGIVPAARWYAIDLADDGRMPFGDCVAAIERAMAQLRAARPGVRMILVSHSWLGLVSEAHASLHLDTTLGLIALAAPLGPPFMRDADLGRLADALRVAQALVPGGLNGSAGDIGRALDLLGLLLDGYPQGKDGHPVAGIAAADCWWRQETPPALTGVPALAIPGQLSSSPLEALATGLAAQVATRSPGAPTHLHWGVDLPLDVPANAAPSAQAEARVALELGSLALTAGNAQPLPGRIDVSIRLWRDAGWLVDGPALSGNAVGRLRRAELAATIAPDGATAATRLSARLDDIGLRGDHASSVGLADPRSAELLDLVMQTLESERAAAPGVDAVLALLVDLGFVRGGGQAGPAVFLADALRSATNDAAAWFAARLPGLLDRPSGLLGLRREASDLPGGGPWRFVLPDLPLELRIEKAPWRASVGITSAGLRFADSIDLRGLATVRGDTLAQQRGWVADFAGMRIERVADGRLVLNADWLDESIPLSPPDPDAVANALAGAIPRFVVDGVLRALIEETLGGTVRVQSLYPLIVDPGRWLRQRFVDSATGLPNGSSIGELLGLVARLTGLESDATHALRIPGVLGLNVSGAGDPLRVTLDTPAPITVWQEGSADASLDLTFALAFSAGGTATPSGSLGLRLPLPVSAVWGGVDITMGSGPSGVTLALASDSGLALTLLPDFGGLDSLVGASAQMLLPIVLDRLALALPQAGATREAIEVAKALGIYDPTAPSGQGFQARSTEIADLVQSLGAGDLRPSAPAIAGALSPLLQKVLGPGVSLSATGGKARLDVSGVLGGSLGLEADFATAPPGLRLLGNGIKVAPLSFDLESGLVAGDLVVGAVLGLEIDVIPGITLTPALSTTLTAPVVAGGPADLQVDFVPFGTAGPKIELAPVPTPPSVAQLRQMLEDWVLPLAGNIVLLQTTHLLDRPMWNGGKTLGELVVATQLVTQTAPGSPYLFASRLPQPLDVLRGTLDFFSGLAVPLAGDVSLSVLSSNQVYGLGLSGSHRFEIDPYALDVRLGLPAAMDLGWGDAGKAVGLLLLDLTDSSTPQFKPVVRLGGLGVGFGRRREDESLIDAGGFRLGGAGGYLSLDIALSGAGAPSIAGEVLGAIEISGLGLMIDARGDGGNAVAASLIKSDDSGDGTPAVPAFDMLIGKSPQGFAVSFSGQPQIRIEINRTMGPLHVKEVSLLYNPIANRPGELGIALDASIAMAGIRIAADDLGVFVPLDRPTELSQWRIDLAGLAVDYSSASVKIGGGLQKARLADGAIEYRGALSINVSAYALSGIGAYARPTDAQGSYTSLFMFLAISAPIGGPPYLFVTGLAGGAGYNRRLLTPRDPASVPGFPLVSAMDGGGSDPMEQMERIGADIPPARGALWLAAGIRFSTFELLRTTALLTVAVDRGFEVSLMGLMRLNLPPAQDATIVSLELALAAKYSTVDQVLSLRAELTDNSWLISRDCKLTGGFAFVVWFSRPEALLTVGGYSRRFPVPAHYPIVSRVGFYWAVGGGIVIKGGSFFAITHSAVMVGGSLEASYHVGPVRAWFIAELDVIVSWDPFHYQASAYVEVGVEIKLQVCLFGHCISAPPLRVTIGASLELEGPPLNGLVVVDAGITTIRIPFGRKKPQPFLTWEQIRSKYVGVGTVASISAGALAGDGQADGTVAKPWRVANEFRLRVETKMPATALSVNGIAQSSGGAPARVDLVPAGTAHGPVSNRLLIAIERLTASGWEALPSAAVGRLGITPLSGRFPGAVWDGAAGYTDSQGNRVADTSRPMLAALASVEIACAPEIVEATGALADIKVSAMVEEQAPRALAFRGQASDAPAAAPLLRRRTTPRPRNAPVPIDRLRVVAAEAAPVPLAPAEPTISALVRPRLSTVGNAESAGRPMATAGIWSLAAGHSHRITLSGSVQRIVGLSATGRVLLDRSETGSSELAEGIHALVVTSPPPDGRLGWDHADALIQAGPATFLAPGAVITAPMPWSPRRSARRIARGRSGFAAVRLSRAIDGLVTRIALEPDHAPSALAVRFDRTTADADVKEIELKLTGAGAGQRRIINRDGGIELVITIALEADARAIEVGVTGGPNWRLTAVLAYPEASDRVATRIGRTDRLRPDPVTSLRPATDLSRHFTLEVL